MTSDAGDRLGQAFGEKVLEVEETQRFWACKCKFEKEKLMRNICY